MTWSRIVIGPPVPAPKQLDPTDTCRLCRQWHPGCTHECVLTARSQYAYHVAEALRIYDELTARGLPLNTSPRYAAVVYRSVYVGTPRRRRWRRRGRAA